MKKILGRVVGGITAGISIGFLVVILINLCLWNGEFRPAMPALTARCATVMQAVLIQTLLTAVTGVLFALAGLLFEVERWSFLQQCMVHFISTAVFYIPFTMLCWFPMSLKGLFGLLVSILVNYTIVFFVNYRLSCRDVRQINDCVSQRRIGLEKSGEVTGFEHE